MDKWKYGRSIPVQTTHENAIGSTIYKKQTGSNALDPRKLDPVKETWTTVLAIMDPVALDPMTLRNLQKYKVSLYRYVQM